MTEEYLERRSLSASLSTQGAPISALAGALSCSKSILIPGQANISGVASFFHDSLPWREIANWTHKLPTNPTDNWMDLIINDQFVAGPNHRWLRHHPVDFVQGYLSGAGKGALSIRDYGIHAGLDFITIKGIPLLPEAAHQFLVECGLPHNLLCKWTHVNIFDVAVGGLSIYSGGYNLVIAITGHLPWGTQTFIATFGSGALSIAGGIATTNPFLVFGGVLNLAAGATSYVKHIHAPAISINTAGALSGFLGGLTVSGVTSLVRMAFSGGPSNILETIENVGVSTSLGTLGAISPWISIPLAISYSLGKFVWSIGEAEAQYWAEFPVSTDVTPFLSLQAIYDNGGIEAINSFRTFLSKSKRPDLSPELLTFLKDGETTSKIPQLEKLDE